MFLLTLASLLCAIPCVQSEKHESLMKDEQEIDREIIQQLRNEMNELRQRMHTLETIIDNLNTQCNECTEFEENDEYLNIFAFGDVMSSVETVEEYKIMTEMNDEKVQIYIHDTSTKRIYRNEFTAAELQKCGFSPFEVQSLQKISKFILNTINDTSVNIKFSIVSTKDKALVKIVRKDTYFGEHIISLELPSIPRKTIDILVDHIVDLQNENENMKENINECKSQLSSITTSMSVLQSSTNEQIIQEINLKLINNWSPYASGSAHPKAYKKGRMIYLQGLVKGGTLSTVIATLPQGWRPDTGRIFCQNQDAAAARVDVFANGEIKVYHGKHVNKWVPLDGIVFAI
eukprot:192143_1